MCKSGRRARTLQAAVDLKEVLKQKKADNAVAKILKAQEDAAKYQATLSKRDNQQNVKFKCCGRSWTVKKNGVEEPDMLQCDHCHFYS
jgi:hypothetical protein